MFTHRYHPYSAKIVRMQFRNDRPIGAIELWRDGRKVGLARLETGAGKTPEVLYEFKAWADECRFRRHLARLPSGFFVESPADSDSFMALFLIELADDAFVREQLVEACRGKTLFHLRGDREDEWREINCPFTDQVADALRAEYGIRLDGIANEALADGTVTQDKETQSPAVRKRKGINHAFSRRQAA